MLREPPGVDLVRTSTYTLCPEQPGWIDLTTVDKHPLTFTEQPDSIDLTTANGVTSKSSLETFAGRPLHTKATYKIVGDCLIYCVAPPGQPRPSELATKKG